MIQLPLLMLFITKQDTSPSNKAGKLILNAQTLSHLATALLSQNVRHVKRANFATRIIIHHCIIRFIIGKMSKHDSTASAPSSTTTKLSGTPLSFPQLIFPRALETLLQILDKFILLRLLPPHSTSPNTALFTKKTTPTHSAAS